MKNNTLKTPELTMLENLESLYHCYQNTTISTGRCSVLVAMIIEAHLLSNNFSVLEEKWSLKLPFEECWDVDFHKWHEIMRVISLQLFRKHNKNSFEVNPFDVSSLETFWGNVQQGCNNSRYLANNDISILIVESFSTAIFNKMMEKAGRGGGLKSGLLRKLNNCALDCLNDLRIPLKMNNNRKCREAGGKETVSILRFNDEDITSSERSLVKKCYELVLNLSNYLSILVNSLEKQHMSSLYSELGNTIIEKVLGRKEGEGEKSDFDKQIDRLDYKSLDILIDDEREVLRKKKWGQELDVKLSHKKQLHECGKEKLGELWMSCRGDMNLDEVCDLARSMDLLMKLSKERNRKRTLYFEGAMPPGSRAPQDISNLISPLLSTEEPFSIMGNISPYGLMGTPRPEENEILSTSEPILPSYFPGRLRNNPKASAKFRDILRELEIEFKQNRGNRELKWSWSNLKKALISLHLLDKNISDKGFSQAISEVLLNTKAEAIRRSFSNSSARYQGLEEIENNKVNDLMARLQPVCDILVRDNPEAKAEN